MHNQAKFTAWSRKLKLLKIRKQYYSIPLDFLQILFTTTIFPFSFSSLVFLFSCLVSFPCLWGFFKQKIYIPIHIWLCERISDKKCFTRPISRNKTTFFFGLQLEFWTNCLLKESNIETSEAKLLVKVHSDKDFVLTLWILWLYDNLSLCPRHLFYGTLLNASFTLKKR